MNTTRDFLLPIKGRRWLWDDQGQRIRCIIGVAVCGLGHCILDCKAICQQAATLIHRIFSYRKQERLADRLVELSGMIKRFCNLGRSK
jgi:acetylornithine/succinyldiaminopimelate/putrescine aminotransferase